MAIANPPTLAGFIAWTRAVMGIPTTVMADSDPGFENAFLIAKDLVPLDLGKVPNIYTLTVYNWAGSLLIQFQSDPTGFTFFTDARKAYGVNSFTAGVIEHASDSSTAESMAIGQGLKNLDILSLQRIKDPYGRQAVAYMQSIGTLWGLT